MAFTYDITTTRGKVRLLGLDADSTDYDLQDEEIDYALSLNDADVKLAAAQVLDVKAGRVALVEGDVLFAGIKTSGSAVAGALRAYAADLRRQVAEGEGTDAAPFAVVEQVLDPFSYRDRVLAEMLRTG